MQDKLQIGHVTCCNLPTTPLRDKFQEKMHHTTPACPIVSSPKKLQDKLQIGHVTRCNLPATPLRDKFQEKVNASCNTCLFCPIVSSPKTLQDKLQIGHVKRCNLPTTSLRDKFQEKMYHVTPAYPVQLFQTPKSFKISYKESMLHAAIFQQRHCETNFNKSASCNTILFCPIVSNPKKFQDKLQIEHVTCCNPHGTSLQDKFQQKCIM